MPNHITNIIYADKGTISLLKKLYVSEENGEKFFDFNKIVPRPKTIEECPEPYIIHNEGEARTNCLAYDGDDKWFNWYNWNIDNWGTKWNSYDYSDGETQITFLTAWSGVPELIEKVAEETGASFRYLYADEGMYDNCEAIVFDNGEVKTCLDGSTYGMAIWMYLHNESPEDILRWNGVLDETD